MVSPACLDRRGDSRGRRWQARNSTAPGSGRARLGDRVPGQSAARREYSRRMVSRAEDPADGVLPSGETTALLPDGEVPSVAPLAQALAPAPAPSRPATEPPAPGTAVDAMRD